MLLSPFDAIVVGVDFSVNSRTVVKQAMLFAEMWKTKLIFVHAVNEPLSVSPVLYKSMRISRSASYYKEQIKNIYGIKSRPIQVIVEFSIPTDLILRSAKRFKNPLTVVGYKSHNRFVEMLFGSTARHLISVSKSPLWMHRGNQVVRPDRLLIAHDLSKESNRGIDMFRKLNLAAPTTYQVYFVREKPFPVLDYAIYKQIEHVQLKQEQNRIKKLFSKYPRIQFQATTGDITEKIVQKTRQFDAVLISHKQKKEFYSSSETLHLMRRSEKPLIVV